MTAYSAVLERGLDGPRRRRGRYRCVQDHAGRHGENEERGASIEIAEVDDRRAWTQAGEPPANAEQNRTADETRVDRLRRRELECVARKSRRASVSSFMPETPTAEFADPRQGVGRSGSFEAAQRSDELSAFVAPFDLNEARLEWTAARFNAPPADAAATRNSRSVRERRTLASTGWS
jgi:hypothetical protein